MEQSGRQFKAFIRLLLDDMKEAQRELDGEKKTERLDRLIDILEEILDD